MLGSKSILMKFVYQIFQKCDNLGNLMWMLKRFGSYIIVNKIKESDFQGE